MYCFLKKPIKIVKEIKAMMTYYYIPVRMAKINNTDNTKCQQECCTAGIIPRGWWECKRVLPPWRIIAQWYLTELNIHLPYNSSVLPLDIYLMTFLFTQKTYMNVHSSFICNSPNLKQPKYPFISE